MYVDEFTAYCLSKKGVTDSFPFDKTTLVFKVMNKMFALTGLDREGFTVNLKCDPERSVELRAEHPEIQPGYHMNKKHWNTIDFEGGLDEKLLIELIDHSYELVASSLKKADKEILSKL